LIASTRCEETLFMRMPQRRNFFATQKCHDDGLNPSSDNLRETRNL
jgi:hypothetical protein